MSFLKLQAMQSLISNELETVRTRLQHHESTKNNLLEKVKKKKTKLGGDVV